MIFNFWQDYSNLIRPSKYNWVNFTFVHFEAEWDKVGNELEVVVGLLGFNLRWAIALPGTTPQKEELLKKLKEIKTIRPPKP
mgnify:CR=1 FL=1